MNGARLNVDWLHLLGACERDIRELVAAANSDRRRSLAAEVHLAVGNICRLTEPSETIDTGSDNLMSIAELLSTLLEADGA